MSAETVLRVENLNVWLGDSRLGLRPVRDFSISVERGRAHGIVGESGSGKSMAVLALMNLLPRGARRTIGRYELGGRDIAGMPDRRFAREISGKRIGMIFQDPMMSLNPVYTIGRQLTEASVPKPGESREDVAARAIALLARVGVPRPQERMRQYPFQLSGGLRQRAMIAMALMNEPDLLIADEPTTALDVSTQARILDLITELRLQLGMALVLITHDVGVISRAVDDATVMYAGEVVETGSRADVIGAPLHPYTRGLLRSLPGRASYGRRIPSIPGRIPSTLRAIDRCVFSDRCQLAHEDCLKGTPAMNAAVEHRAYRCVLPPATLAAEARADAIGVARFPARAGADAAQPPLIEVRDLRCVYKLRRGPFRPATELVAIEKADLDLRAGEVLAVVGESGSGKTTLAKILLGLERASAGAVFFEGRPIAALGRRERARSIQAVFQDPYSSLNPRLTIGESIRRPLDIHGVGSRADRLEAVHDILRRTGLDPDLAGAYPAQLSGGQRQRVAIARAVIMRPKVVICDEPTSALDVSVQAQILNLLLDMRQEFNLTYLLITHDLGVVRYIADRIAVFDRGRIVEFGTRSDILETPAHAQTRALLEAAAA